MANKSYSSLGELVAAVKKAAGAALESPTVLNVIKEEIRKAEQQEVYDSYATEHYWRRGSLGKNFQVERINPYAIQIWDIAPPAPSVRNTLYKGPPGWFAQWINDGRVTNIFNNRQDYPWTKARPFYETADTRLQRSTALKKAVLNGIKSQL